MALLPIGLKHRDLCLHSIIVGEPGLLLLLQLFLSLLLGLDLLIGAAALRAGLEEIGGDALAS